ncbi:MAG: DUF1573 domain-containing protein [Cyclobacteriaceae bacterium]|nr:DUF1573 domain-containing protein [Cyclobacteriaceae bacterium]
MNGKMKMLWFCVWMTGRAVAQPLEPLQFQEKTHDFGEVEEEEGIITYDFVFTNMSPRPVKIVSVNASCGCTTPDWTKDPVAVGKTGFVRVNFDPAGRPGYFNKSLTLVTDSHQTPVTLQIKGNVVRGKAVSEKEFPAINGQLRLRHSSFNLGKVYVNKANAVAEFEVVNKGPNALHISEVNHPGYLKTEIPRVISAGEKGLIKIWMDANARKQWGFVSESIHLATDDPLLPEKYFSVYATIEEFFPVLTPEQAAKAPALKLSLLSFDLGRIKQGNTVLRQVVLKNTGKAELAIREVQPNCPCVSAAVASTTLKPGQETMLTIGFDTQGRSASQQKAVTIYSNDPKMPVQRVTLTAFVED